MENEDVKAAYKENLEIAKNLLHKIPCDQGWNHDIPGLNGWIFENVISDFIKKEMDRVEIEPRPKLFARGLLSSSRMRSALLIRDEGSSWHNTLAPLCPILAYSNSILISSRIRSPSLRKLVRLRSPSI